MNSQTCHFAKLGDTMDVRDTAIGGVTDWWLRIRSSLWIIQITTVACRNCSARHCAAGAFSAAKTRRQVDPQHMLPGSLIGVPSPQLLN